MSQLQYFSVSGTVTVTGTPSAGQIPVSSITALASGMSVINGPAGVNTTITGNPTTGYIPVASTAGVVNGMSLSIGPWLPAVMGAQGQQGYQGAVGSQGPSGIQGPQGLVGPPSPTGTANNAASTVTLTGTSQLIANGFSNRKQIWVYNNSGQEIVYLSLGGTATVGAGIRINPGGGYWTSQTYLGSISAICTNNNGAYPNPNVPISWSEV